MWVFPKGGTHFSLRPGIAESHRARMAAKGYHLIQGQREWTIDSKIRPTSFKR